MLLGSGVFLIPLHSVDFWSGTKPSLPIYNLAFSNPNHLYNLAHSLSLRYFKETTNIFTTCALLSKLSGSNIRAGLISDIYEETVKGITGDNPLGKFIFDNNPKLPQNIRDSLQILPSFVPKSINGIATAILKVYLSIKKEPPRNWKAYVWDSLSLEDKVSFEEKYFSDFDIEKTSFAFQVMCLLLDSLKSEVFRMGKNIKSFYLPTPYGYISFGSQNPDSFPKSLIVVDAGGDDVYNDVKMGLDIGGNDVYLGNVGSGIFDISAFVDLSGNDTYKGDYLGSGFFGYGALWDSEGNDIYKCGVFCLGAGYKGGGILVDLKGKDEYYAISKAQGFGWVGGVGVLVDVNGDDFYKLEDSLIVFPSPQSPRHNTSLGQGMGFGERRDFYNGKSLGGGLGILVDVSGNDRYYSHVFSQGSGYWLGIGVLYDGEGNDAYSGVWYSQGASAHFGIGILYDLKGDDVYFSSISTSQGVGHDFSYGILFDGDGSDTYTCGNLCLGSGNAQGIGVFWDRDGNMKVNLKGAGMGMENPAVDSASLRVSFPTRGFVCKGKTCP